MFDGDGQDLLGEGELFGGGKTVQIEC